MYIFEQIKPGLSSLIKVDDVDDVLEESPSKLADSLILFCQVQTLMVHPNLFIMIRVWDYFLLLEEDHYRPVTLV